MRSKLLYHISVFLSGGNFSVAQKHKSGSKVKYNSGFFITTNVYPDFCNEVDCEAIRKRLEIFQTTSLPKKDIGVSGESILQSISKEVDGYVIFEKSNSFDKLFFWKLQSKNFPALKKNHNYFILLSNLAWLRQHCMDVFHYVAEELKDVEIFTNSSSTGQQLTCGSIYNDTDHDPLNLLHGEEQSTFCYSQITETSSDINTAAILQEGMEYAIAEADSAEHMTFHTDHFETEAAADDELYLEKVYLIASGDTDTWESLVISEQAKKVFGYRLKHGWSKADSVYDAWLLLRKQRRSWFRYDLFFEKYPEFRQERQQKRLELLQEPDTDVSSGSETESLSPSVVRKRSPTEKPLPEKKLCTDEATESSSILQSDSDHEFSPEVPCQKRRRIILTSSSSEESATEDDKTKLHDMLFNAPIEVNETIIISSDSQ